MSFSLAAFCFKGSHKRLGRSSFLTGLCSIPGAPRVPGPVHTSVLALPPGTLCCGYPQTPWWHMSWNHLSCSLLLTNLGQVSSTNTWVGALIQKTLLEWLTLETKQLTGCSTLRGAVQAVGEASRTPWLLGPRPPVSCFSRCWLLPLRPVWFHLPLKWLLGGWGPSSLSVPLEASCGS